MSSDEEDADITDRVRPTAADMGLCRRYLRILNFRVASHKAFHIVDLFTVCRRTRHDQRSQSFSISNRILVHFAPWKQHGLSCTGAEYAAHPSAKESEKRRLASVVTSTRVQPEQETASGL